MPILHVGGTNGKGSVCATLTALLRAKGLRVGLYSSPHLVDFRERFTVDGQPMPADEVTAYIRRWMPEIERLGATFFEATTAMAFDYFARSTVDIGVIEVGLGGRLDSTNVVHPLVAAVTSIGFDHTEYLGTTLEEIADEKAGIFKTGAAAAIGELSPSLRNRLAMRAAAAGADPVALVAETFAIEQVRLGPDGTSFRLVAPDAARDLRTPLVGRHQAPNTALALLTLRLAGARYALTLDEAERALRSVRLAGRFQQVGPFIFDVAHNRDGAAVLAATLAEVAPARPVVALLCVLGDKDWRGMMEALAPRVDAFILTQAPTAPASRAWVPEEAGTFAAACGWPAIVVPDFDRALATAQTEGATVVVTGSFHTAGDAMARLQVSPFVG